MKRLHFSFHFPQKLKCRQNSKILGWWCINLAPLATIAGNMSCSYWQWITLKKKILAKFSEYQYNSTNLCLHRSFFTSSTIRWLYNHWLEPITFTFQWYNVLSTLCLSRWSREKTSYMNLLHVKICFIQAFSRKNLLVTRWMLTITMFNSSPLR